jgi:uncharacterized Fe-S cluster-containing radical SAM superfamily protein
MLNAATYNPVKLAQKVEEIVSRGTFRKYYRAARSGRWYGGIATSDCCGCNLKCIFCWSGLPRDNPERVGKFYSPQQIFSSLIAVAKKFGYSQLRVSGNEPTIGMDHLLELLGLIEQTSYTFILESNGILIDEVYARQLSKYRCVHARISIKGTNPREFALLTGAEPEAFHLQLNALRNLLDAGVSCHPAVMLSFTSKNQFEALKIRLREIDAAMAGHLEKEYIFLYPHVVTRLDQAGVKPLIAYKPEKVPKELI